MPDDLEQLLREAPRAFPDPDPDAMRRAEKGARDRRPRIGVRSDAAVVVALLCGIGVGYWLLPREEVAIGAAEPAPVTIEAEPRVISWSTGADLVVRGRIAIRAGGQPVALQENVCGSGWQDAAGTQTRHDGTWELTVLTGYTGPGANALVRASWRGELSTPVAIGVRPGLALRKKVRGVYTVDVSAARRLDGRTAVLERYVRDTGRWVAVQRRRLGPTSYGFTTRASFRATLRRGTIIRAVLPAAQARPCYLAGYSRLLSVD